MSRVFKVDYIPDPDRGRPLWNAKIFVGVANQDPTIPSNQIQLTGDIGFPVGQSIPVPQPVRTNAGGITVYNNSPLDLNAPGQEYAIQIFDRNDNLIYNFPQVDGSVVMNTTSQEEVTGLTIWPEVGEAVIGQTIPAGTDAIRYPFNGRSTLFTIKPPVAVTGTITNITINSSGIGELEVDNSDVYDLAEFNSFIAANDGDSQLAGGNIWPLSSQESISTTPPFNNVPSGTVILRDASFGLFTFEPIVDGDVTVWDPSNSTATIGGQVVSLSGLNYSAQNVENMVSRSFPLGSTVETKGYFTPSDGGSASYIIVPGGTGTEDGGTFIDLNDGNQAKKLGTSATAQQFGIFSGSDESTRLSNYLNSDFKLCTSDVEISIASVVNVTNGNKKISLPLKALTEDMNMISISGDNVRVTECDVDADNLAAKFVVLEDPGANNKVYNNELANFNSSDTSPDGTKVIDVRTKRAFKVTDNTIRDISAEGNGVIGDVQGSCRAVYVGYSGGARTEPGKVTDNLIINCLGEEGDAVQVQEIGGVEPYQNAFVKVDNNQIFNVTRRAVKFQSSGCQATNNVHINTLPILDIPNPSSLYSTIGGEDNVITGNIADARFYNSGVELDGGTILSRRNRAFGNIIRSGIFQSGDPGWTGSTQRGVLAMSVSSTQIDNNQITDGYQGIEFQNSERSSADSNGFYGQVGPAGGVVIDNTNSRIKAANNYGAEGLRTFLVRLEGDRCIGYNNHARFNSNAGNSVAIRLTADSNKAVFFGNSTDCDTFNTIDGSNSTAIGWDNLNLGSSNSGLSYRSNAGTPVGVITPYYQGELVLDTTNSIFYRASGNSNGSWVALNS